MRLRFIKCKKHPEYRGKEYVWNPPEDCTCPIIYRAQNPLGSPQTKETAHDKHAIYLWLEDGLWRFLEAFEDDFDAVVSEQWMQTVYATTDTNRQFMLECLAEQIGMI